MPRVGRWYSFVCRARSTLACALLLTLGWPLARVSAAQDVVPEVPPAAAPPGAASGPYIGVWTGGPSSGEAAALDALNVGWARVTVVWSSVQPAADRFDWVGLDQSMANAFGNGRRTVLALVRNNPAWAAAYPCTLTSDAERKRLAEFLTAVAGRYKGIVWQLYNEEDNVYPSADAQYGLGGCFGAATDGVPTADGRVQYARTIEAAAAALRTVDPSARLAAGGVASGNFVSPTSGAFDPGFLPGVLAQLKLDNSLASLDYVAVHYFSSQAVTYAATGTDLLGRVEQLRRDTLQAGLTLDELKPVLADELSFTDLAGQSTANPTDAFNLAQRAYVPRLLARAAAAHLRAAFWFWLQDAPAGLGADNAYGLKDLSGTPKPAYDALRYFVSQISRTEQLLRPLELSALAADLEGYEFAVADGRVLQVVWTNVSTASYPYAPTCQIAEVKDTSGTAVDFDGQGNTTLIGGEPRYVFCQASAPES